MPCPCAGSDRSNTKSISNPYPCPYIKVQVVPHETDVICVEMKRFAILALLGIAQAHCE